MALGIVGPSIIKTPKIGFGSKNNLIKSSQEEQAKQQQEQTAQIQKALKDVVVKGDRAFKQFDISGLSKIPSLKSLSPKTLQAPNLMPVLPLTKPGHIWGEISKVDIDNAFAQQNKASPYIDYNDPKQVNDLLDVVSNTVQGRGGFIEDLNAPDWAKFLLRLTPVVFADMAYSAFNNLIYDTSGDLGGSLIENWFVEPIKQHIDGNIDFGEMWKAIGINSLMVVGQSLDVLANPIKGFLKEGPEGLFKALGFTDAGRVNYDWNTQTGAEWSNIVLNIVLEMMSDPINWVTFGGKAVIGSLTKKAGVTLAKEATKSLSKYGLKTAGKELSEASLQKSLEGTGKTIAETFSQKTINNMSKDFADAASELISKGISKNIDSIFLKAMGDSVQGVSEQVTKDLIGLGYKQGSELFQDLLVKKVNQRLQQEIVQRTFRTVVKQLSSRGFSMTANARNTILKVIQRNTSKAVTLKMTMQVQAALTSRTAQLARTFTMVDDWTITAATFGANKLVVKGISSLARGSIRGLDNLFAKINNRSIMKALADTSAWGANAKKLLQKGLIPLDKFPELTKQFNDLFTHNMAYLTDVTESVSQLSGRQVKHLNKLNTNAFLNNANPFAEQMTRQLNMDVLNYNNFRNISKDPSIVTESWQRYIASRYGITVENYAKQLDIINKLTGNRWQNQITQMRLKNLARTYEIGLNFKGQQPLIKAMTPAQIEKNNLELNKLTKKLETVPTKVTGMLDKATGIMQERTQIKLIKGTEARYIVYDWINTEATLYDRVIKNFVEDNPNIMTYRSDLIKGILESVSSSEKFHDMLTIIGNDPRLLLDGFEPEQVRLALIDALLGLKNIPNYQSNKELVTKWIQNANEKLYVMAGSNKYVNLIGLQDVLEELINNFRLLDAKGYTDMFKPFTDFTSRGIIYNIDSLMKRRDIINNPALFDELKNLRFNIIASLSSRYQTGLPMYLTRMHTLGNFADAELLDGLDNISVTAYLNRNLQGLTSERALSAYYIGQYFDWDEDTFLDLELVQKMNSVSQTASSFKTRIIANELIESNATAIQKTYKDFIDRAKTAAIDHKIYNPFEYLKKDISNKDAFAILYSIKQNLNKLYEFKNAFRNAKRGQTALNTLLEDSTPLVYTGIRMDTGYYVQQAINALLSPDTDKAVEALNQLSSLTGAEASLTSLEQLFKKVENLDPMVFENQEQLQIIKKYKEKVQEHYRKAIISKLDTGSVTSKDIYEIMQEDIGSRYFTDEHFETLRKMYSGENKTDIELLNLQAAVDRYNSDRLDFDRIIRQNLPTDKDYIGAKQWLVHRDIPLDKALRESKAQSLWLKASYLDKATPSNGQKLRKYITQREQLTYDELVEYFRLIDELGDYLDIKGDIPYDLIPNSVRYALQFEELDAKGIGLTFSLNQRADKTTLEDFNKQYNLNSAKAFAGLDGIVNKNNKEITLYLQTILAASQTSSKATQKISRETATEFAVARLKGGKEAWEELSEESQEIMLRREIATLRNVTNISNDFYVRFKTKAKQGIVLAALTTLKDPEWNKVMSLAWGYLEKYPTILEQLYTANYIEQFFLNPASVSLQFNMNNITVQKKTITDFVTNNWKSKLQNVHLREMGALRGLRELPDVAKTVEKVNILDYNNFASTMYERIIANSDFSNAANPFVVKESHSGKFLDISKPNDKADAYAQAVNRGLQEKRIDQAARRLLLSPEELAQDIAISGPAIVYFYDDLDRMGRIGQKYFNYKSNKPWTERLTNSGRELNKYGIEFIFDDTQRAVLLINNLKNTWYDGQKNKTFYTNIAGQRLEAIKPDNNYQYTSLGSIDAELQKNLNEAQLDLEYLAGQTLGWSDGLRLDLDFYDTLINGFNTQQLSSLITNQAGQGFNAVNYWKGLDDEAKAILVKQGWGTVGSDGIFDFSGVNNALHYNTNRFNEMVMGSTNNQRRLFPYLSNNPIVMMNKNMQEAAMLAKTQTTYIHNMMDETFSINKGVYSDYTDKQLFELLMAHPQMRAVTLVPKTTGRGGFGIKEVMITNLKNVAEARKIGARIIPSSIYKRLYNTLNNRIGSQGFLKYWNRLMYIFKFGYLGFNVGTATRNYIDTNLKTNIELGATDANVYRSEAAAMLNEFDTISNGISKVHPNGLITSQGIKDYFNQNLHRIDAEASLVDYDTFLELQNFFKYGPISNITEASKRATRQITEGDSDAWQSFVKFSGAWTGALNRTEDINRLALFLQGLDKSMTREASFERIARIHFDYGFKSKPLQILETLFPFMTYSIRNAEYWLKTISEKPWVFNMIGNIMSPIWNFDEYSPEQLEASWSLQNQILQGQINLFSRDDGKDILLKLNPSFMDAFQITTTPIEVLRNRLFTPVSQLIDVITGAINPNDYIKGDYGQFPEYYTAGGNLKNNTLMKSIKHYANYIPIVGAIYNSLYTGLDQGVPLPSLISAKQLEPTPSRKYVRTNVIKWIPNRPLYMRKVPSYKQQKYLWNKYNFSARTSQMYKSARTTPLGKRILDPYKASGASLIKNLYLKQNIINRVKYNTDVKKKVAKAYTINNYAINRAAFSRY